MKGGVWTCCGVTTIAQLCLQSCESERPVFYATNPARSQSGVSRRARVRTQQLHRISFSLFQLLRSHGTSCIHGMQADRPSGAHIYSQQVPAVNDVSTCDDFCKSFRRVFVWRAVNAWSETPGNNAPPNSQINRIHSLCGISF